MSFFGNPRFLGIDFGTAALKVVEFELVDGKPVLVNYGVADLSHLEEEIKSATYTYDEAVNLYLHALLVKMQPKTNKAYVAMPAYTGLIALVEFPELDNAQMNEAVRFEAHKYVPTPSLDDVALSWEIVGSRKGSEGDVVMDVLLVAALKKEVERYRSYIQRESLEMSLLEIETFAIVRALLEKNPGSGMKIVIDIGSRATNIILTDDGSVKLSRNIDTGGKDITRTLSDTIEVVRSRAEELKKSGKDFLNQPESAVVFPTLQVIITETKRIIASHEEKHPGSKVTEIILSGGSSRLAGVVEYFSSIFDLPVDIGHPWSKIQSTEKQQAMIHNTDTSFAVAIGLALGGAEIIMNAKKQGRGFLGKFDTMFQWKI
ncbi:MAG: type IV pilus assembly protein PilM [Candidatus Moranbacteria bacterium]|nr:type IV pilus assembly protein PilM [Candidatus Moranbacteria bacterium]